MVTTQLRSRGFTLIAALLLLLLLSGIAVGLMYMVNTETRVGGSDLENSLAFHSAEGGMEKMTADLANLFSSQQAPTPANIAALQNLPPVIPGVTYRDYTINVQTKADGSFYSETRTISSGPNAGLMAQIVPMTLSVTAQRPLGDQVHMYRTVEIALIPVFQFGVFSDSDLSYFPGPVFDFAGRVHTNGNLFLADGNKLQLHDKVSAVGEVIRAQLANGYPTSTNYTGSVFIPRAPGGCDITTPPATNCRNLAQNEGSKVGGVTSANNNGPPSWTTISTGGSYYNSFIINGRTGAVPLNLPFVGGGATPIQIIRRPAPNEMAGSAVGGSRLYNQAQVRVLLADTAAENHAENPAVLDADDVQLSGYSVTNVSGTTGVSYFGVALPNLGNNCTAGNQASKVCDANYVVPRGTALATWPLNDGWLRVEILKTDGTWKGVTREWLAYGFSRDMVPPNSSNAHANAVHPNAILIFQQQADRDGNGAIGTASCTASNTCQVVAASGSVPSTYESKVTVGTSPVDSRYNWLPINFYDPREGEVRDVAATPANTCAPNGVMNAIELDVGNLRKWLRGNLPGSGTLTDYQKQNGYVLFYSDRRGMQLDPTTAPQVKTGKYGFEDVINSGVSSGTPDGTLELAEDVDANGQLDRWGAANVGDGFGVNSTNNPFANRQACMTVARKNRVSGARHVLRLVNGSRGNVPTRPDDKGGFTVASENPVYILGDYNAKASDNGFVDDQHAAAAVIADAVTLLSNSWSDAVGWANPTAPGSRIGRTTWYRVAIAGGKNINFQQPTWSTAQDFGTDGGVHNFLRYIESWSEPLHYRGSLVSLYYSQYADSVFKCCTTVYGPPSRDYSFDTLFLDPAQLPPGTPMFRDVANTSYRQDLTPSPY